MTSLRMRGARRHAAVGSLRRGVCAGQQQQQPARLGLQTLGDELQLVRQAMYTEPEDQSAWMYHRWLLGQLLPHLGSSQVQISSLSALLWAEHDLYKPYEPACLSYTNLTVQSAPLISALQCFCTEAAQLAAPSAALVTNQVCCARRARSCWQARWHPAKS